MNEKIKYYLDVLEESLETIKEAISKLREKLTGNNSTQTNETKTQEDNNGLIYLKSLKYNSNCSKCGKFLKRGWGAYYDPKEKKIYCSKCKNG